ncbi:S9 family peptidase [bacterium AH-315-P15]|nr:S9 family peptidase [bacterium AH-315-P15]
MRGFLLFLILILLAVGAFLFYWKVSHQEPAATATSQAVTEDIEDEIMSTLQPDATPLIPRALLFGNPSRSQARLSPDGSLMSFLAPLEGVMNIWVAPAGNFEAARAVTQDTGRGIRNHSWALNGAYILFPQDTGGNELNHIHAVNIETHEVRDLTPFDGARAITISDSFRHPDEILVGINNRDASWFDPYRLNIITGELTLIEENTGEISEYLVDKDFLIRAGTRSTPDGGFDILAKREGRWERLLHIAFEDSLASAALFLGAGHDTLYALDSSGRDTAALISIDLATGMRMSLAQSDLADISEIIVDPASNEILAYGVNYQRLTWTALDAPYAVDLARLDEALIGDFVVVSQTLDNSQWIIAEDAASAPVTYHLYDRNTGNLTEMFSTRPELGPYAIPEMSSHIIEARDGLSLVSYLGLPLGSDADGNARPDEPLPMVLWVHGGPWARDVYGFRSSHAWITNRGYAILYVNFRGSTGLGKSFTNAGDLAWGTTMHDDLIDAVNWAVREGIADPNQVAIMGGSYGGYATLAGLTFTPETFACGVDIVGPSNLESLLAAIPPYWAAFFENLARRVGDPRTEDGRALLAERSPLYRAHEITRPLLIGQGANDPRVPQSESNQIVAAMEANGLPVTYVVYPDEGHGFARPQNNLSFFAISEAFLAECLGGRVEPIGPALLGSSTNVVTGAGHVTGLAEALEGFTPTVAQ